MSLYLGILLAFCAVGESDPYQAVTVWQIVVGLIGVALAWRGSVEC